jgi:hypothetical protein
MDLLAWRESLHAALECTEENVFTRIEMGQSTAFYACTSCGIPEATWFADSSQYMEQCTCGTTGPWRHCALRHCNDPVNF